MKYNEIHYFIQLINANKMENNSKIQFKNLCNKNYVNDIIANKKEALGLGKFIL